MTAPEHTAIAPAPSGFVRGRLVGAAAIAFAVLAMTENVLFGVTGAPGYGDPVADVLAYYAANRGALAAIAGVVALYLPLLLVFLAGLHGLVVRRGGEGTAWSRLALAAGAALVAILVLFNVLQIGLVLSADGFTGPTTSF